MTAFYGTDDDRYETSSDEADTNDEQEFGGLHTKQVCTEYENLSGEEKDEWPTITQYVKYRVRRLREQTAEGVSRHRTASTASTAC